MDFILEIEQDHGPVDRVGVRALRQALPGGVGQA